MYIDLSKTELAEMFESHLLDTNRGFNYYINWKNINDCEPYMIEIHAMDVLIGCDDDEFQRYFHDLLVRIPRVIEVIPYLFALSKKERESVRGKGELKIIGQDISGTDSYVYNFNSDKFKEEDIEKYYELFEQMGLKNLFQNIIEKSVLDYIIGVLVGLDSNGRKNRGGKIFELACEPLIQSICDKYGLVLLVQKQFKYLKKEYGYSVDKSMKERKADFIVGNKEHSHFMNIEVNFYNDSGSKPEEIINSYIQRQEVLEKTEIGFCQITDGECWRGTTNQLMVGFNALKYLLNYNLAKEGMLEEIIRKEFNIVG